MIRAQAIAEATATRPSMDSSYRGRTVDAFCASVGPCAAWKCLRFLEGDKRGVVAVDVAREIFMGSRLDNFASLKEGNGAGFIEEQNLGRTNYGSCNGDPLLLPTR